MPKEGEMIIERESGIFSKSNSNSENQRISAKRANEDAIILSLEKRVAALETILGSTSNLLNLTAADRTSVLESKSGVFPLVRTVGILEKKAALLNPQSMDILRTKASNLRQELELAHKVKSATTDSRILDGVKKIDSLAADVQGIQSIASEVPSLIIRLKTLQGVHARAATFRSSLDRLETAVGMLKGEVNNNGEVLNALRDGLKQNCETFKESIRKVNERMGINK
jgi:archaellum component FlaC